MITSARIKELRDLTGVGMAKCKEALEEAHGDMEKAVAVLRKAGEASAVKKQGRSTKEGKIGFAENQEGVALVEVNAETDFVVQNEKFQLFLKTIAEQILQSKPKTLEDLAAQNYLGDKGMTVEQFRSNLIQTIGENIVIKRFQILSKGQDKSLGIYSHMNGKILAIVELQGNNSEDEMARAIAMQVAAHTPEYLSPEKVPQSVIESEKDIARSQIKGKPENMIEKIVEGKVKAYFVQACLSEQKYIRDESKTIAELVSERAKATGKPLKLSSFTRWFVGE